MNDAEKFRFLLSGPGLIGRKHAQLLDASDRSELSAIVAPRHDDNIAFAARCDVPMYETIDDALQSMKIDAAIIASPNKFHAEQALRCIDSAIPVLVEKPLTSDVESARLVCQRSSLKNVPVLVGHHRTYNALLSAAHDFIRSERFGQLVAVEGSAMFRKPEHYFAEGPWRTQPGGGPIMINLIHDIGILQYLCGPIVSVSAISSNARRGYAVEDTVAISMAFENGALGTFIVSDIASSDRSWELSSGENPAYPRSPDANCYHFAGTNGSLDFPTMRSRFYRSDVVPSWWNAFDTHVVEVEPDEPLEKQLGHFEDVIAGAATPIVSARIGLENMRVVESLQEAVRSRRVVDLEARAP